VRLPVEPDLFEADTEMPVLKASFCAGCGRVSFPALLIGCDCCGASEEQLKSVHLPAVGEVHSFATVYIQQGQPTEPFTIAEIALDGGPLIRAMVAHDSPALHVGDRISGEWVVAQIDDVGNDLVEPVFTTASG
jgi:uncharacterized OB-fold protein